MKLNKIEPKFIKKNNPRIGLITLASDFRIEKDFNDIIYGKDIDLYSNRINCYNPLTNETLKKMADDIPEVTKIFYQIKNQIVLLMDVHQELLLQVINQSMKK